MSDGQPSWLIAMWQGSSVDYIKSIKITSSFSTFAVVQMDFAENFSFFAQKEIQSAYWNQKQATVYPIVISVGTDHRNVVIISNRMVHDTSFVYCAQKLIVTFIREEYPTIQKINYVRYETISFHNIFCRLLLFSIQWRRTVLI